MLGTRRNDVYWQWTKQGVKEFLEGRFGTTEKILALLKGMESNKPERRGRLLHLPELEAHYVAVASALGMGMSYVSHNC